MPFSKIQRVLPQGRHFSGGPAPEDDRLRELSGQLCSRLGRSQSLGKGQTLFHLIDQGGKVGLVAVSTQRSQEGGGLGQAPDATAARFRSAQARVGGFARQGEVLGQTCFEGSELLCAKRGAARLHSPRPQHPLKLTAHLLE